MKFLLLEELLDLNLANKKKLHIYTYLLHYFLRELILCKDEIRNCKLRKGMREWIISTASSTLLPTLPFVLFFEIMTSLFVLILSISFNHDFLCLFLSFDPFTFSSCTCLAIQPSFVLSIQPNSLTVYFFHSSHSFCIQPTHHTLLPTAFNLLLCFSWDNQHSLPYNKVRKSTLWWYTAIFPFF